MSDSLAKRIKSFSSGSHATPTLADLINSKILRFYSFDAQSRCAQNYAALSRGHDRPFPFCPRNKEFSLCIFLFSDGLSSPAVFFSAHFSSALPAESVRQTKRYCPFVTIDKSAWISANKVYFDQHS